MGAHGAPRAKPVVPPQEYPPTPRGAEALRGAGAKASEGYPPVAKSAEAVILRFKIGTDTAHAFIVRLHRLWPTASTGRARGLLRRRIKKVAPPRPMDYYSHNQLDQAPD